jgi:mono/diheme cytochrome c family protein
MSLAFRLPWRAWAGTGVLAVALLVLAACGGGSTPAPTVVVEAPAAPTAVPPTEAPTREPTAAPTATLAPTDAPEPTATAIEAPSPTAAVVADASNCVTCHTSEETLQQLAKEEDPAEELSEGEG